MDEWIKLNVGGQIFLTKKRTLVLSEPNSMLAKMFSGEFAKKGAKDEQGAYMIDRNPDYFQPILNYLRTRELVIDPGISKKGVLVEAQYFGIQGLVDQIEKNPEVDVVSRVENKLQRLKELIEFQDKATELARKRINSGLMSVEDFKSLKYKVNFLNNMDEL